MHYTTKEYTVKSHEEMDYILTNSYLKGMEAFSCAWFHFEGKLKYTIKFKVK